VELAASRVIHRVSVDPPCNVICIHDELDKVRTIPGVSQIGHHIYVKICTLIKVS
jgi:hypothetical protein